MVKNEELAKSSDQYESATTQFQRFFFQVNEFVVEKITALQVKSLPELLQSSSVIGSATQNSSTVSVKCLVSTLRST